MSDLGRKPITSRRIHPWKALRFVVAPLVIGGAIGVLSGVLAVVVLWLLPEGYSDESRVFAFVGFVCLGLAFGLPDAVRNLRLVMDIRPFRKTSSE
jgi:hypothetical protein